MKMARYHTGRQQFISFFGGFHGRTMGALSLTGSKNVQKKGFFPLVPGVHHVPYPNCYRCPYGTTPDRAASSASATSKTYVMRHIAPARRNRGNLRRAGPGRRRLYRPAAEVHG